MNRGLAVHKVTLCSAHFVAECGQSASHKGQLTVSSHSAKTFIRVLRYLQRFCRPFSSEICGSKDGRIVINSNSLIRGFKFSAFSAISNLTPSCTVGSTDCHGVNSSTNTNILPKSTTRNRPVNTWCRPVNTWCRPVNTWCRPVNTWCRPVNTWCPQVNYACRNRRLTWIPGGRGCRRTTLYPGDINTDALSTSLCLGVGMTPSPCTVLSRNCNRCKPDGVRTDDPARSDVRVNKWSCMEWRSLFGAVTAGSRL
jgi:hypothetical protein